MVLWYILPKFYKRTKKADGRMERKIENKLILEEKKSKAHLVHMKYEKII